MTLKLQFEATVLHAVVSQEYATFGAPGVSIVHFYRRVSLNSGLGLDDLFMAGS
jgi:hypothetical protein